MAVEMRGFNWVFFSASNWELFWHVGHDWDSGSTRAGHVFHIGPFELIVNRKQFRSAL
jgi:hypothetical protein